MKTITEHIRASLESKILSFRPRPDLETLRSTQWSSRFEKLMRNRLILGALRYETFDEKRRGHTYKLLDSVRRRLNEYERTGNQEFLVDSANILMIEFECPTHPNPHFQSIDDGTHVDKH